MHVYVSNMCLDNQELSNLKLFGAWGSRWNQVDETLPRSSRHDFVMSTSQHPQIESWPILGIMIDN